MLLKIREIRNKKNITQDDLALRTGLSKRMIIDYEKEIKDIPLQKLQLIATALNVTLFEIINLENEINEVREPETEYKIENKNTDFIQNLLSQVEELKRDKEELRNDKKILQEIIDHKLGNQNAS